MDREGDEAPADHWRAFCPSLEEDAPPLLPVIQALTERGDDEETELLDSEIVRARNEQPNLTKYIAALSLLRDLKQAGWGVRAEREEIQVRPHQVGAEEATKASVRRQLLFGRTDQFRKAPIRTFVDDLERPARGASRDSVVVLIADGLRLARQLRPVTLMPRTERAAALRGICRPYIEIADRGVRDRETGIDLYDVWRYCRYAWSSRYRRSPGRVIPFLVRDSAQPHHPVMAIFSLSNGVMQLGPRDEWVGWSVDGVTRAVERGEVSESEVLDALRLRIRSDLAALYTDDLGFCGHEPPPMDVALDERLNTLARQAATLRADALRAPPEGTLAEPSPDMVALARTPLFMAKRASSARVLLRANDALSAFRLPIAESLKDPNALWAFQLALRQTKQQFASRALMEITTCGAIPPYNHLLAGKLACLLAASPDIVNTYRVRYGGEASVIASQMAGRPIVKDTALAMLGTTSLYPGRSSQYNRVRLPAGVIPGQIGEISYVEVGRSGGHGSSNLSAESEELLAEIAAEQREFHNVNFIFGEGQSPKMRQIREGLEALGVGAADIIRHGSPRTVYVVPLLSNTRRFLLGVDQEPRYEFPIGESQAEHIAEYWRTRWLASRIDYAPALDALAGAAPEDMLISREWRKGPKAQRRLL